MHDLIDKIKRAFNKLWYGTEVRKVRVTVKDLEKNVIKIQDAINANQAEIDSLNEELKKCDRSDASGEEKYKKLQAEIKSRHELYSILQKEMELEYNNIKKQKDCRFIMSPKDALVIGGAIFIGTFMIALERENPKAIKLCEFIMRLFPMHL